MTSISDDDDDDSDYDEDTDGDDYEWRVFSVRQDSGSKALFYACCEQENVSFTTSDKSKAISWGEKHDKNFPEMDLLKVEHPREWSREPWVRRVMMPIARGAADGENPSTRIRALLPKSVPFHDVPICKFDTDTFLDLKADIMENDRETSMMRKEAASIVFVCDAICAAIRCEKPGVAAEHMENAAASCGTYDEAQLYGATTLNQGYLVSFISTASFYSLIVTKQFLERTHLELLVCTESGIDANRPCFTAEEYLLGTLHFINNHLSSAAVVWAAERKLENLNRVKSFMLGMYDLFLRFDVKNESAMHQQLGELRKSISSVEQMLFEFSAAARNVFYPRDGILKDEVMPCITASEKVACFGKSKWTMVKTNDSDLVPPKHENNYQSKQPQKNQGRSPHAFLQRPNATTYVFVITYTC